MQGDTIEMPDGTKIHGVPSGISKKEFSAIYERWKKGQRPEFEKEAEAIKNVSWVDLAMGSAPGRFVSGVADMGVGGLQLASRALPGETGEAAQNYMDRVVQEREAATKRGDVAYGREGFDWMRLMGNIMNPAALKAGSMIPQSLAGKVIAGGGIGAGFGLTAPVEDTENYWKTKGGQTAVGTILGAATPLAVEGTKAGSKWLYHLLEPLWGKQTIKAREYMHAAGDKTDEIIDLLKRGKQHVPGSKPTAGEAAAPAGRAEFSGLQARLAATKPSLYRDRSLEQQAARSASLKSIAKDEETLNAAIKQRGENAAIGYGKAWAKHVKGDAELVEIASSPYFDRAYANALKIAKTENISPDSVEFLHIMKKSLEEFLGRNVERPLGPRQQKAVTGLVSRLVDWIEDRVPEYKAARLQFIKESGPINRMEVGQELQKTLTQPISDIAEIGTQRTSQWMGAVRDSSKIIKKAGGDPRFGSLKEIFTPDELGKLEGITRDLARRAQHEELARAGAGSAPRNIVAAQVEREAGASGGLPMLDRAAMLLNNAIRRLQGKAGSKVQEEMAGEMLDPAVVAGIMERARLPKGKIVRFLKRIIEEQPIRTPSAIAGEASKSSEAIDEYGKLLKR